MIICDVYRPGEKQLARINQDAIPAALADQDALLWVELSAPEESELTWLAETFCFHQLAMEDVRNEAQRPKLDSYGSYNFFVLRRIVHLPKSHSIQSEQVDCFIGSNYLVVVHRAECPELEGVRTRWEQLPTHRRMNPSFLFYLVADAIVDAFFPIIDNIGDIIDEQDQLIFKNPDRRAFASIFRLRRGLLNIRRVLGPMRDAFNEYLRIDESEGPEPGEGVRMYLSDVYDHVLRLSDFVDTYRDMLSGSMEAYQSSISNKLNENMQHLTIGATVLTTTIAITGFYGMNLRGLGIASPLEYGSDIVVLVIILITLIELWLFKRAGWL
ncbi:MAG: magnesium/cobalt transporter CorA [bacterium]